MTGPQKNLQRRCPRLGGPVFFDYCRTCGDAAGPCWKVFDCWWESFDVIGFFRGHLPPEQFEQLCRTRPRPKIASILELVEQARKRAAEGDT